VSAQIAAFSQPVLPRPWRLRSRSGRRSPPLAG